VADSSRFAPRPIALVNILLAAFALAVSSNACGPADKPGGRAPVTSETPSRRSETRIAPGIHFDPASLRPGMHVGDLVADSVAARQVAIDSSGATGMIAIQAWVGTARFRGHLTLRGHLMKHPDSDVRVLCFEADSASAKLMPRWAGDTRRPWFCFSNVDAARLLGGRSEGRSVEVVIDELVIHRSFSDDVNSARLVRTRDLASCYRSPHSILLGPTTRTGQQGRAPGWVRLEGFPESDHGAAELHDSGGKALGAGWRRQIDDSVALSAGDDFLRVELRFMASKGSLVGQGKAHSDAALEPDSTGRLSDLRRSWKFAATEAPCDSMQMAAPAAPKPD
jgi:hypothetical protein